MEIFSLSVFVVLTDKIDVKTGHLLSICFCLQAASDFYFVAPICMICLVETLGASFILHLFVVFRLIAPRCTLRRHYRDDEKEL